MIPRIQLLLVPVFIQFLGIVALTDNNDYVALKSLQDGWENVPPTWEEGSSDPCGDHWEGVGCNGSKVVSLTLSSMDLSGKLSGDIEGLSELQILDLSYNKGLEGPLPREIGNLKNLYNLILVGCGFSGLIPDTIGSLSKLKYLSLNSNKFIGPIPPSLGKLSELYWLDLADNDLTGSIPVSDGNTPGLDMLVGTRHFHFGGNQFSGEIPAQLFSSNMKLKHLLLEQNQLKGSIPETLGLVRTLEVVRLDRNSLSGSVPSNLNNLTSVSELHLSNNKLEGPFPNLTDMSLLNYVYAPTVLDNTGLEGLIPPSLFSLVQLQNVIMRNNKLNGTLNIGPNHSSQLQLIDLRNNLIDSFTQRKGYNFQISLVGNPFCLEGSGGSYCAVPQLSKSSYSTPTNCLSSQCSSDQISSPNCKCAYPYTGNLVFRAPSFSNLENSSIFDALQESMMHSFKSQELPVDSVSLSNPADNPNDYLVVHLQVFPNGMDHFNRTGVSAIGFALSNQTFKPPPSFGPFFFQPDVNYKFFDGESTGSGKSLSTGVIIGAAVGGSVLVILVLIIGVYAFCQKRKAQDAAKKHDPFASWDRSKSSGTVPQLQGAKFFSFEELAKCTNNFSEANTVGSGGYGKQAMDKTKDMYDLQSLLDPAIAPSVTPRSLEKFVDIALRCLEDVATQRPTMREVVKEIESIMEMVGLNPHADSASTSESYSGVSKGSEHPYSDESLSVYTGVLPK
nr:probable leucine-rich repeat receptor-like protein kinase At5g49770 [Ipomoea batatas]